MDVVQDADIDWQLPNKFIPGDLTGEVCNTNCQTTCSAAQWENCMEIKNPRLTTRDFLL